MEYPQHNKLEAVREQSQAIGEFLEWLDSEGVSLHVWGKLQREQQCMDRTPMWHREQAEKDAEWVHFSCGTRDGYYLTWIEDWKPFEPRGLRERLAEFFGIDYEALHREKEEMLREVRAANMSKAGS